MQQEMTIAQFRKAIKRLPVDEPYDNPNVWYRTQKEHWLGWLSEYSGPGAYDRKTGVKRDAKYAYNHIVNPQMLLYLIHAIPLRPELVAAAENAYQNAGPTLMAKSGAIRKVVPWSEIYQALSAIEEPTFLDRLLRKDSSS